jgi:two-component system, chemotaxis family, chemotaxis protein CheY
MRDTVLIVDDSAMMRKIVLRALSVAGLEFSSVLEAADGNEGLEVLKSNKVQLIMCDINMPGMNGLDMLRAMRTQNIGAGIPVVMVTTESSAERVREAVAAGASGYIRKPFSPEQVKLKVIPLLAA